MCSQPTGQESPALPTCETWAWDDYNQQASHELSPTVRGSRADHLPLVLGVTVTGNDWTALEETSPPIREGASLGNTGPFVAHRSSPAGSPARTSASPDGAPASPAPGRACSTNSPESLTLFSPPGCSSRTYPDCSPATMVGTSASWWERWPTSGTAWPGGCSTHATSESPSGAVECSLSDVLEATTHRRYELSARAARGVLRRSVARGRPLPTWLQRAFLRVASSGR